MITIDEFQKMNEKDLAHEVEKLKLELFKQRLAVKSRQSNNTAELKKLRVQIAQLKSLQRARKIETAPENKTGNVTK